MEVLLAAECRMSINMLQSRLGVRAQAHRSPLLPTPNYRLVLPAPAPFYRNVFSVSSGLPLWIILILWAAQEHSCQGISSFCSLAYPATGRAGFACLPAVAVRGCRSSQRDRTHRGTAPFLSLTPKRVSLLFARMGGSESDKEQRRHRRAGNVILRALHNAAEPPPAG